MRKNNVIPAKVGMQRFLLTVAGIATLALATCFFLTYPVVRFSKQRGLRWTGAGFVGTLAGLASAKCLPSNAVRCGLALTGAILFSVVISDVAEELLGQKDDQRIVIDEWVGYLASVALLPKTPIILFSAFVLFRIIDTWKPTGVRQWDRLPGGWGVVMDDLAGGLLVNALLRLLPLS
jgi:phosphatidylglycerophosphatase A